MSTNKNSDFLDGLVEQLAEKLLPVLQEKLQKESIEQYEQRRLTIPEAARYIGTSEDCLYNMCRDKLIPHFKIGAKNSRRPKIIFSQRSLDLWIKQQETENYSLSFE
ncbi:helix-turn-helix domain-containing protein [Brevibacillus formosus]|uniref:helix-turn-helix domain-containing protein n=1 Tax=Brevibacillus formosus TaxID=54913 RepID=UPI0018CFB23B|nr:helix-turn-helix domain-containing protein [Brevibacillus formosus]